ncbi:nucleotidyltransferase family protein [Pseudarthrobacter sp. H3Y2-7]|uniref:nucleotidyltransferase family protein n=1 Tax=Pseudarthrobacter naphthalenicus TaxID=3031328 RepID=UPI0023AED6B4|nr:nucleotidyltransferase family protein [Pseudarthrobacter sp. H3Y2-7]MDE8668136.1 nucleotidyltransferase family protein [Pseudarthrobacter sp. H3Y2-7]
MANPDGEAQLCIPEAVLLGHAMVQRVADSLGIRAFFIKGPASVIQGLRLPRTSGDVDVFVHPSDLEAMIEGLRKRGWRERPVDPDSRTFPKHSVTVDHPEWPCCIDVHFRFPGMERHPADCFQAMWANTEDLELAGLDVRVPSKELGLLILALHALRSPHLPACRQELQHMAGLTERESMAAALLDVSASTGSLAAMRPFLEPLVTQTMTVDWPTASVEWRNRLLAKEPGSARLIAIAQAPLKEKPLMLFRGVFPVPEVHLSRDIYADMSLLGRCRSHRARWARFLLAVPKIVRDLGQFRKIGR